MISSSLTFNLTLPYKSALPPSTIKHLIPPRVEQIADRLDIVGLSIL